MRKVTESVLPGASSIHGFIATVDYEDTFSVALLQDAPSIGKIYLNVFAHSPKWVNDLLALRNRIAGFLGLKTGSSEMTVDNLRVGRKTGIFWIYAITENEIIAGEDDRHLNFRVSVLKHRNVLTISTLVQFHNRFGKLYFTLIKPFHKMVVRSMMKSAVKNGRI